MKKIMMKMKYILNAFDRFNMLVKQAPECFLTVRSIHIVILKRVVP